MQTPNHATTRATIETLFIDPPSHVSDARTAPVLAASAQALTYLTSTELRARFLAGYRRVRA